MTNNSKKIPSKDMSFEDIELEEEIIQIKEEEKEMSKQELSELELLKQQVEELRAMLGKQTSIEPEIGETKVRSDDYVPVMSLLPNTLNLSTKGGGQGTIKRFTKFGEVKNILYRDLVDIMDAHTNFLEAGYFYILNEDVIRQHGLNDLYDTILTKEKIEQIIQTEDENAISLYKNANPHQKEIIINLLVDKVFENLDSVNLNIVDKISRDSGVDILEKAEDRKRMLKIRQEEEEERK